MKKILLSGFLLMIGANLLQAQSLDANNIKASIFSNGSLFFNGTNAVFEVPQGSGLSTVFAANLWIGSMDGMGNLRVAAQTYAQPSEGGASYNYGPVTDSAAYTSIQLLQGFSRVIKLNKTEIDQHRLTFTNPNYTPISALTQWIANGDTTKGVSPILMPYHDSDGSGIYSPLNGDFPVINGDQALQVLFSDNRVAKTAGNGRVNINVALQAFALNTSNDSALNNTVFLRYRLHNVSGLNYDSLYLANWTDFDIGYYQDDYVGSDPSRNAFYGYNATNNDDPAQAGYGANPPAQAVVFLSHPMNRFVYYNNDSSVLGNPVNAQQKFNYMRGLNLAGQPIAEQFMFAGNPVAGTGSNELSLGNTPGDRRGLGIMPPISLPAGASICVDFAYVYGRGSSNLNSITVMSERVDAVRNWYQGQSFGCLGQFTSVSPEPQALNASAYPNPFQNAFKLQLEQPLQAAGTIYVLDVMGKEVFKETWLAGQQEGTIQLDLPAGMYVVQVRSANKQFSTRLIKQ